MRLISYNILDGGEGRADPLAEVIEAQRPDVVALMEATDLSVIEHMARRFAFDYVQAPGNDQASALLTRWTIRESINHALLQKGLTKSLLEATLIDPAGVEVVVGVVHLHHHAIEADEVVRQGEIAVLLDVFARHRNANQPHIICGDFNADSPTQVIDPAQCKESTQKAWRENGGGVPRRAIGTMLSHGYVDTLHAVRPDYATTHGTFTTQTPGQRVDYLFTHGIEPGRINDAWIEYDRLAKYASDHFPVGLEIE